MARPANYLALITMINGRKYGDRFPFLPPQGRRCAAINDSRDGDERARNRRALSHIASDVLNRYT